MFFSPCWNHLVVILRALGGRVRVVLCLLHVVWQRARIGKPWMHQQLRRVQSLGRRFPHHAANQTLGLRRQPVGQAVGATADLGEQRRGLRVLEGVATNQHSVQSHAQAPDVRRPARVRPATVGQQFGTDVGRTAMSVSQRVVLVVTTQEDTVVEAEQGEASPVLVHEDEAAELQVPEHHSMAVAVHDSIQHLREQEPCLLLTQALPVAHVRVHVAVMTSEENVHVIPANHHVEQPADVVVTTDPSVRLQALLVTSQREHLAGVLLLRVHVYSSVGVHPLAAFKKYIRSDSERGLVPAGFGTGTCGPEAGRETGGRRRRGQTGSFTFE